MQKADKGEKNKEWNPKRDQPENKNAIKKEKWWGKKARKGRKKERKKKARMVAKDQRNHEQKENNLIYKGYNPPDNRGSLKVIFLFFPNSFYDHSLIEANNAANQTPIT